MFPLGKRRIRGDLIEVFKILSKFDNTNPDCLFEANDTAITSGSGIKLQRQRCNTLARQSYFNYSVVRAKRIVSFKETA